MAGSFGVGIGLQSFAESLRQGLAERRRQEEINRQMEMQQRQLGLQEQMAADQRLSSQQQREFNQRLMARQDEEDRYQRELVEDPSARYQKVRDITDINSLQPGVPQVQRREQAQRFGMYQADRGMDFNQEQALRNDEARREAMALQREQNERMSSQFEQQIGLQRDNIRFGVAQDLAKNFQIPQMRPVNLESVNSYLAEHKMNPVSALDDMAIAKYQGQFLDEHQRALGDLTTRLNMLYSANTNPEVRQQIGGYLTQGISTMFPEQAGYNQAMPYRQNFHQVLRETPQEYLPSYLRQEALGMPSMGPETMYQNMYRTWDNNPETPAVQPKQTPPETTRTRAQSYGYNPRASRAMF